MKRFFLLLNLLVLFCAIVNAQTTKSSFDISFKGKSIGTMYALETITGTKSVKDLRTNTDVSVFAVSVHVESEVKAVHDNGSLIQGTAYRHANRGDNDVVGHVTRIADKTYERIRNGEKKILQKTDITMCSIDLLFREPKGVKMVFSNMYTEFLPLKETSPGNYTLVTPDNKSSYYSYKNGKLMKLEVDTPLGRVVSTRIN